MRHLPGGYQGSRNSGVAAVHTGRKRQICEHVGFEPTTSELYTRELYTFTNIGMRQGVGGQSMEPIFDFLKVHLPKKHFLHTWVNPCLDGFGTTSLF